VTSKKPLRHDDERGHALFRHGREGAVELVGTSGLQELKLHPQGPSGDLKLSICERLGRIGRVREDRHAVQVGTASLSNSSPLTMVSSPTL
jgi:hypothetical protein